MSNGFTHAIREADAARILGLSVSTVQKYRVRGGGPAFMKLGHRVVYELGDLEEWKRARRVHSTSEASVAA
jgi:predicted DNA-binding transcriptional regulator AlpA